MCSICLHSPCLSGCPNAPDPTPVTYCRSCGEPIIPGDEYADIDGEAWCEGCLDGRMLTTVYDIGHDEPTVIHHYNLDEEEEV